MAFLVKVDRGTRTDLWKVCFFLVFLFSTNLPVSIRKTYAHKKITDLPAVGIIGVFSLARRVLCNE